MIPVPSMSLLALQSIRTAARKQAAYSTHHQQQASLLRLRVRSLCCSSTALNPGCVPIMEPLSIASSDAISYSSRSFSTSPVESTSLSSSQDDTANLDTTTSTATTTRNKSLESIIRQGWPFLNTAAMTIQAHKNTRKALFQPEEQGPTNQQKAEEHRILSTVLQCLEELSVGKDSSCFCIHHEPITIIRVEVNVNLRNATVFWALPYSVLLNERFSAADRLLLTTKMSEIVVENGHKLQRAVHTKLSSYYPPRLRFEAAPAEMTEQSIAEFESW